MFWGSGDSQICPRCGCVKTITGCCCRTQYSMGSNWWDKNNIFESLNNPINSPRDTNRFETCPRCGYMLPRFYAKCPNCGYPDYRPVEGTMLYHDELKFRKKQRKLFGLP